MSLNFTAINTQTQADAIQKIFKHLNTHWETTLNQNEDLQKELNTKLEALQNKTSSGIIGLDKNNQAEAIAILDKPTKHYGNLTLYTINPNNRKDLISAIKAHNLLDDIVVELFQFTDSFEYRDQLIAQGYIEKERQRMVYEFEDSFEHPLLPPDCKLVPFTEDLIPACAEISTQAHEPRSNIEGYHDFVNIEGRKTMAENLRNEKWGTHFPQASNIMLMNKDPAGSIDVIALESFHYSKIAWIMDVAVKPQYQGYGIGRTLVLEAMHQANKSGYPAIGLGVTLSNKHAKNLYETLGYTHLEYFVEFICPAL